MALIASVVQAQVVPVQINEVRVDRVTLVPNGVNKLDIDKGQTVEVQIVLDGTGNSNDVEVQAFLSGYEYNTVEPMSTRSGTFQVLPNVSFIKRLQLPFPKDADVDDYKLRVIVSDRNNRELIQNYNLRLDSKRHDVQLKEVIFYPDANVKSGTALLTRVRLENYGQNKERDVRVQASLPDLGVSSTDYINEIRDGREEETEEMYLKLPCAKPGQYPLKVDVSYDNGHGTLSTTRTITLSEGDLCKPVAAPPAVVTPAVQPTPAPAAQPAPAPAQNTLRNALEVVLIVLIGLLVIVGLVIGFSRMRQEE